MSFGTYLEALNAEIDDIKPIKASGRVVSVKGVVVECKGISDFVSIGSCCKVNNQITRILAIGHIQILIKCVISGKMLVFHMIGIERWLVARLITINMSRNPSLIFLSVTRISKRIISHLGSSG